MRRRATRYVPGFRALVAAALKMPMAHCCRLSVGSSLFGPADVAGCDI
jgi:hypothetical protein